MIVAFTGHRPNKLSEEFFNCEIKETLIDVLKNLNPKGCISGMAQGFDQFAALTCVELGIPFIAAIPYRAHISPAPTYQYLLQHARKSIIITEGEYNNDMYWLRDKWMVDNAFCVVAAYNGDTSGGTYITVKYARQMKKDVINVWPLIR